MAQTMTAGSDSPSSKHNIAGTLKVIRECAAEAIRIKGMRKALNDEMGEVRTRLRDNGVQTATFDLAVRLKEMEPEAQGEYVDSLRLNFEALAIGGQSELVLDTVGEDQPQDVAAARKAAQAAGEAAGTAGHANTTNPYKTSDPLHGVWQAGWMTSTRKRAEEMTPKNAPATPAKPKRSRKKATAAAKPAEDPAKVLSVASPLGTAPKAGRAAAEDGEPIEANPHEAGSQLHEYWAAGWKSYIKQHPARHTAPTNPEPADIVA